MRGAAGAPAGPTTQPREGEPDQSAQEGQPGAEPPEVVYVRERIDLRIDLVEGEPDDHERISPTSYAPAARSANFAYRLMKATFSVPVGPLRCLAR